MSYTIWPREMARVSVETGTGRDRLRDALQRVDPLVGQARDGAGGPVAAELDHFAAAQQRATTETLDRIESALVNGALAVDAYVRGDVEMAAQYGRASIVFTGPRPLPPPPGGPLPPEQVSGG